jgi:acetyl-CoA carboxylase biotin carboxyl carrier protein
MPSRFNVDPDLIRRLAEILNETGLGEIEYAEGERRIRVARPTSTASIVAPNPPAPATPNPAAAPPATNANAVKSPMVGTAYLSPEPGSPFFVKIGDRVSEGQTLLIIEAMKVMNPIKSPRGGVVTAVLVENAAPVEYGEPLIVID